MARGSKHPDIILLGIIATIIAFGFLILASVSAPYSLEKTGTTFYYLKHQILVGLIPGLIFGFFAFKTKLENIKKRIPRLLLLSLVLMIIPIIVSGPGSSTARWIYVGSFSFQPSELLKLTFILYLASWLSKRTPGQKKYQNKFTANQISKTDNFGQTFFAFLAVLFMISALLVLQSHASTLMMILIIAVIMYFSANTPIWHNIVIIFIGIGGFFSLIKFKSYRLNRFMVFLNPDLDPMGRGYQIGQAKMTIGSGGLWGKGLGMSSQKLGFLPQTISDSIFAVFSEEAGFLGNMLLIALFLFFLWRGFKIVKETEDKFSQLLAIGIISWIILQAFVNIGAMIGILPLTGVPLSFVSYGGSALAIELVAMGLLLNISKHTA